MKYMDNFPTNIPASSGDQNRQTARRWKRDNKHRNKNRYCRCLANRLWPGFFLLAARERKLTSPPELTPVRFDDQDPFALF
jgi:hypothetical protein